MESNRVNHDPFLQNNQAISKKKTSAGKFLPLLLSVCIFGALILSLLSSFFLPDLKYNKHLISLIRVAKYNPLTNYFKQSSISDGDVPTPYYNVAKKNDLHPAVKPLEAQYRASSAMSARFRSISPRKVQIWYDDRRGGTKQGFLEFGHETTTNTYEGHVFFFTDFNNKDDVLSTIRMERSKFLYIVEDPTNPAPPDVLEQTRREVKFLDDYYADTGLFWRHYVGPNGPRAPPEQFMWPATEIGQVHRITSPEGYWHCRGEKDLCQSKNPVPFELEVISLAPRAFVIPNFLSDVEVSEIIALAAPGMFKSSVGDVVSGSFESSTRTSSNSWVKRDSSPITESLFIRASHLLRIKALTTYNTEHLQVVRYVNGQKYDSHHDWGVSGYPESRLITLLLYLTDMVSPDAGGETAFPKADNGRGIKVHPGKGSAVLFYNLLEDGNGDDLALHAALPTRKGEKWLANFWVWDPHFRL